MPVDLIAESDSFKGDGKTVYPDNWLAYQVFMCMITQWRIGMNGLIGMDYTALSAVPRVKRMSNEDYDDTFMCLQVMERAALQHVRSKQ